jgi:predicted phosphodiesterase
LKICIVSDSHDRAPALAAAVAAAKAAGAPASWVLGDLEQMRFEVHETT